ncbi:MAG: hypothetical protein WCJ04_05015 [Actinomycetes bacterium]
MNAAKPVTLKQLLSRPLMRIKLIFMTAGFLSLVLSVGLWASGNKLQGIFVGLWVPSIHALGALLLAGENWGDQ